MKRPITRLLALGLTASLGLAAGTALAATGGPDGSGYTFKDSSESGCSYNFSNIVGLPGTINLNLTDDSASPAQNLGFSFDFYGTAFTTAYASSNGYVTFGSGSANLTNQCPLPNLGAPSNLIAGVWDDLLPSGANNVYFNSFAAGSCPGGRPQACAIFQWNAVSYFSGAGAATFQIVLRADNVAEVHFFSVGQSGSASTTGIENSGGTAGLTYFLPGTGCNQANSISGQTAVFFLPPGTTQCSGGAAISPPTIGKSFGAPTVPLNGSTSLSFTLANPNAGQQLTGVGFSDPLPAGLVVANPNGLSGSCGGGTITAVAGDSTITLANATLTANASCTFAVDVTGTTAGVKNNVTGNVASGNGGNGGTASASLTVVAPPTIQKSFGNQAIPAGAQTTLSFTVANPNATLQLTGVGFSDPLPEGLAVANPNGLSGSCGGGTITALAGSGSVTLAGATLAAGASCTFSVGVTGVAAGMKNNVTSSVASTEGGSGEAASARMAVVGPVPALGGWGLALLAVLLGLSAFFARRRPS